jgi:hypothetical protein
MKRPNHPIFIYEESRLPSTVEETKARDLAYHALAASFILNKFYFHHYGGDIPAIPKMEDFPSLPRAVPLFLSIYYPKYVGVLSKNKLRSFITTDILYNYANHMFNLLNYLHNEFGDVDIKIGRGLQIDYHGIIADDVNLKLYPSEKLSFHDVAAYATAKYLLQQHVLPVLDSYRDFGVEYINVNLKQARDLFKEYRDVLGELSVLYNVRLHDKVDIEKDPRFSRRFNAVKEKLIKLDHEASRLHLAPMQDFLVYTRRW